MRPSAADDETQRQEEASSHGKSHAVMIASAARVMMQRDLDLFEETEQELTDLLKKTELDDDD